MAKNQSGRKRYRVTDPGRFFGALILLVVLILAAAVIITTCGKGGKPKPETSVEQIDSGDSYRTPDVQKRAASRGELTEQIRAFIIGLLNERGANKESRGEEESTPELLGYTVVIDAGHGGKDEGNVFGDYKEKDLSLAVALELKKALEANPRVTVIMTREDDVAVTDSNRQKKATSADPDFVISLHFAVSEDETERGITPLYNTGDPEQKEIYEILASQLAQAVANVTDAEPMAPAISESKMTTGYGVPAFLLRLGYISNAKDQKILGGAKGQKETAEALAECIMMILGELKPLR